MGEQDVHKENDTLQLRAFKKHLLNDIRALEKMLSDGIFETDIRRVGAEQELFLVSDAGLPACVAPEVLEKIDDPHYTTELGRFNLEINLEPTLFGGNCLSKMEAEVNSYLEKLRKVAHEKNAEIALVGILPTLRKSDLGLKNMTPNPRYFALNEAMCKLRGGAYEFQMRGKDELILRHDSIMVEACNASFQVHFQVGAKEFPRLYNFAQVVTAPVLAAAVNSPILFGRRLWKETRIAVFEQAVDTRKPSAELDKRTSRVSFGNKWVEKSVLELYKEDITRFRVLLGRELNEDPFEKLEQGIIPELQALRLHNGTVYRWNRACYGINDNKPHLRIENRVIPCGPTPLDEVANAAFFFGLMSGMIETIDDVRECMDFDDAKENFVNACHVGLEAQFTWLDGRITPVKNLICEQLIPLAQKGLETSGIKSEDIDRYLGVIEKRVSSGMTGAQWILNSQTKLQKEGTVHHVLAAITSSLVKKQKENKPVHQWPLAKLTEAGEWRHNYFCVEHFMNTDLFTVHPDEVIDLVATLMDWNHLSHVMVKDSDGKIVGLVSYRRLLRLFSRKMEENWTDTTPVSEIMQTNLITVTPETSTIDAIKAMRENEIPCLPVIKDDRLVGIVTERDFMKVAGDLLIEKLQDPSQ